MDREHRRAALRKAIKGCAKSAKALIDGTPVLNDKVAQVLTLCRKGAPPAVVRAVLLHAIHEHPRCIHPDEPGSRALMRELFGYAQYPKPAGKTLTLWRGVVGVAAEVGAEGYFWGTERETAIRYALWQGADRSLGNPTLLCAQVPGDKVACVRPMDSTAAQQNFSRGVYESEVILLEPPAEVYAEPLCYFEAEAAFSRLREGLRHCHRKTPEQVDTECRDLRQWLDEYRSAQLAEA
ncbi:MAG TPA: hypothetical protein PK347_00390 [Burkholderiaceae bacterium]|nr:hypothetical protein [Burkholderiaceae bacterium]